MLCYHSHVIFKLFDSHLGKHAFLLGRTDRNELQKLNHYSYITQKEKVRIMCPQINFSF